MYSNQDLIELVDILRTEETETEWLEFKLNYVVVTLPNVNYDVHAIENDTEKETVNDTVNDTVKQVLNCIKNNNAITIAAIMKELGKSRPTITRAIAELKEKGYIERIGSDKSGSWKVLRY